MIFRQMSVITWTRKGEEITATHKAQVHSRSNSCFPNAPIPLASKPRTVVLNFVNRCNRGITDAHVRYRRCLVIGAHENQDVFTRLSTHSSVDGRMLSREL